MIIQKHHRWRLHPLASILRIWRKKTYDALLSGTWNRMTSNVNTLPRSLMRRQKLQRSRTHSESKGPSVPDVIQILYRVSHGGLRLKSKTHCLPAAVVLPTLDLLPLRVTNKYQHPHNLILSSSMGCSNRIRHQASYLPASSWQLWLWRIIILRLPSAPRVRDIVSQSSYRKAEHGPIYT